MPKEKKPTTKKIDNRKARRRSAQQSIPFDECYENGLFRLDEYTYSFVCELSDCGYLSKTDSEQNRKYQTYLSLLNELPPNVHYQEYIYNLPIDREQYLSAIASKDSGYADAYEETFFGLQRKFVSEIGRDSSKRRYLIAFSYRNEVGEDPYNTLYDTLDMLREKFLELDSGIRLMKPGEVFAELYHVYNPFGGTMPELSLTDLFRRGLSIRDIICPDGIEYKANYIRLGDAYCRVFSITSYGSEIIDSLIHKLLSQNVMLYVSKHLDHQSKDEAIAEVESQYDKLEGTRQRRMQTNAKNNTNYIPLKLLSSIEGCQEVLKNLYGNEEFFRMTVYVMVAAHSPEELTQYSSILVNRASGVSCKLRAVTFNQEEALAALLPLGKDYLKRHQFMLSSEAAVATPFSYENYFDPEGFYYGVNDRSGTAAILNRKLDKSSNGFVFGVTGSGKGIFVKNELTNVLYQPFCANDDIIVVDPTGEYLPIAEACGGEVVSLTAASDTHINPLHISDAQIRIRGKEAAIAQRMEFLVAFLSQIKEIEPLTASEKTTADAECMELFREKKPTLGDLYDKLCTSSRPEAAHMKDWLERYVKGSITLFAGESTVTEQNRFTVYDLRDLTGDLKNLGMLAMLAMIQDRVMENNAAGKWTWIYIDEFHRFFDEIRNPYSAEMFARMYSELRKFGGILTGITQLPLPVIQSKTGATMLANSTFVVSSELDAMNIDAIAPLYRLNADQQRVLAAPQMGQYILRTKGAPIQLKLLYPGKKHEDKNKLYDLFNTDFKDRAL